MENNGTLAENRVLKIKTYSVIAMLDNWVCRYIATADNYKKAVEIGERFLKNAFYKERWTFAVFEN